VAFPGFGRIEKLGVFLRTGNAVFESRFFSGASIAPSFEDDLVGPVPDPVQGRRTEQFVIEGFSPFGEVQVAGDHCSKRARSVRRSGHGNPHPLKI